MADLGIRREDKNEWERRVPLTPKHVEILVREQGHRVIVQPSDIRIFPDDDFRHAGARVEDDLSACRAIVGVKEMPAEMLVPGPSYLAFFHVIKGQAYNMPLLRQALDQGVTLLDYEPIVDSSGQRLVFFGRHAGYAGMIDGLWALGQRLAQEGVASPLQKVRRAFAYDTVEDARATIAQEVGREIREHGIDAASHPLVIGFTGSGNVSQGAQEVLDELPVVEIAPEDLATLLGKEELSRHSVYKVAFRRQDRADFARFLPYLTMLVNGIYWEEGHPRLVTRADAERLWATPEGPKLKVLADLSCDIAGSIEVTVRTSTNGDPVYVYSPATGRETSGVAGHGPVVLAVDNLPAELPRSASRWFGDSLLPLMPSLIAADLSRPIDQLTLLPELQRAVITHQGRLTPAFQYLDEFVSAQGV
ncbi:MAG: bifunctional lysine ketoglutarate reductase /saccharopine dehydrogenase family protein [Acidobacteriota bacterium]